MRRVARLSSFISAVMTSLLFYHIKSPKALLLFLPKLLAQSLTPYVAVLGTLGAVFGWLSRTPVTAIVSGTSAVLSARYVLRVTAPHDGFDRVFGAGWQNKIPREQAAQMLERRWAWRLPASPEPRWERDVAFWAVPGAGRPLLCDIWQPPRGVPTSGLAFVYFHGSAWHYLDKDFGTRPFFRHLAAQGHVVMDVAYRLAPQVDVFDMVGDVKRAIAWMKANAENYGVNPGRIVVAGGSAGGHLALLAAYAPDHPELTPDDVKEADVSVQAVVSYYGPADLRPYRERVARAPGDGDRTRVFAGWRLLSKISGAASVWIAYSPQKFYPAREIVANLLGAQQGEVSRVYELASPITHVSADCPPTLLFHGTHDALVPVETARNLYHRLLQAGVPAVYVEFPQTEHVFDVALSDVTQNSPPAQAALYDVERFLALMT